MVYRNTRTLKTPNFNHKLLILWLITGGLEYFFMDRKYVRMFLSLERTFWRTFFKKIFFLGVHLLAHSAVYCAEIPHDRCISATHRAEIPHDRGISAAYSAISSAYGAISAAYCRISAAYCAISAAYSAISAAYGAKFPQGHIRKLVS